MQNQFLTASRFLESHEAPPGFLEKGGICGKVVQTEEPPISDPPPQLTTSIKLLSAGISAALRNSGTRQQSRIFRVARMSFLVGFFFLFFLFLFLYYIYFKLVISKYWKRRNVFHLEPVFILGNALMPLISEGLTFAQENRYKKWKEKKLVGYWMFSEPHLLITDLEIIRRIWIRDFNHFTDRNINFNEEIDPLSGHLVNLRGSRWRNLRTKLTPTFTSGKMKMMFPAMAECGSHLQKFLEKPAEKEETIDIKEILPRFTTDIIASCAFGIESNCMNNPDSEFRTYGKKIFEPEIGFLVVFIMGRFFPRLREALGLRIIPKDISDFFFNVFREMVEYREKNNVKRDDFLQLLIQLKNKGRLDDDDQNPPAENNPLPDEKISLNLAASQAYVFFAAGFESSSTTLSYAFYELALQPEVQATLQKEIDIGLRKTGGKMTYESLMDMEYLDWVILETLRKYPPVPILGRNCTKDYEIPEMGVKVEKGTRVLISVLGIHRDPEYFPDPERFDPNRFSREEKSKRDRLAFLAFGEGPRNCIGNRFGLLQTKVGLVSVLSEFTVEVSKETPIPLQLDKKTLILSAVGAIPLKITKRKQKFSETFP